MKRSFLFSCLFVFCFFVLTAAAQEADYIITESELTRLEALLEKWENIKQTLSSQIRNLETELNEALKYQASLTDQLTQARLSLMKSEKSLEEYEEENMKAIAKKEKEIQKKEKKIDALEKQGYRLKLALVISSCVLGLLILGSVGFFILKIKLKFL